MNSEELRNYTNAIFENYGEMLRIPFRQRSKFEGWLKIMIVSRLHALHSQGRITHLNQLKLEPAYPDAVGNASRADIGFADDEGYQYIELKTINTNYQLAGVINTHINIAQNIQGVIDDIHKIRELNVNGHVVFVVYPLPPIAMPHELLGIHLLAVSEAYGEPLVEGINYNLQTIRIDEINTIRILVCCLSINIA